LSLSDYVINIKTFSAFYNPAQELSRDLTVISIVTYMNFIKYKKEKELKTFNEYKFNIIKPLSVTGLRCIKYFAKLPIRFIRCLSDFLEEIKLAIYIQMIWIQK